MSKKYRWLDCKKVSWLGKRFFHLFFLSILPFIYLSNALYAGAGKTGAEFLLLGAGARPTAMGEAFTAVSDDANSINYNPAGLGNLNKTNITLTHNQWLETIKYEYLSFAQPIKKVGTFGFSFAYLHMGNIIGRDLLGRKTKDFTSSDLLCGLSFGRSFKNISFGVNTKFLREKIEDISATGFAFDFGTIIKLSPYRLPLSLGLAVQNLGSGFKFVKERTKLPFNVAVGMAYIKKHLILSVDGVFRGDSKHSFNIGGEFSPVDFASVRTGYKIDPSLKTGGKFSVGCGFGWRVLLFDYAFVPFGDLGDTHKVSLSFKFREVRGQKSEARSPKSDVVAEQCSAIFQPEQTLSGIEILKKDGKISVIIKDNNIYFEEGKYELKEGALKVLERVGNILRNYPEYQLEISCKIDKVGDDDYNKRLSVLREFAIFEYFVNNEILPIKKFSSSKTY